MATRLHLIGKVRGCEQTTYKGFTDGQGREVPAGTSTKLLVLDEDSNKVVVTVRAEDAPAAMQLGTGSDVHLVVDSYDGRLRLVNIVEAKK